jgi:hypothetical protein
MTDTVDVPTIVTPEFIADVFRAGSGGDIELAVDASRLGVPLGHGVVDTFAFDLHAATRALTGHVGTGRVKTVAVLYADRYGPHQDALGLMFDRGFVTDDDPGGQSFKAVPREACAVFLGAIAAVRDDERERRREAQFSTIHELGHVFNLQHAESTPNYLATSPAGRAFVVNEAFDFTEEHKKLLASCSLNPAVFPGGSQFGSDAPLASGNAPRRSRRARPPVLRIGMPRDHFFFWEPVELDVELRASRAAGAIRVPDEVDPGYQSFVIWIEEPSGERRRYRSPRHYCRARETLRIEPGAPFRRDISIFGESGGYTFRRSGVHRIWAEFRLGPRTRLRSNALEVDVRSPAKARLHDQEIGRVLTRRESRVLLYHRLERFRGRATAALTRLAAEHPRASVTPGLHYAIGRALVTAARARGGSEGADRLWGRARGHLARAVDAPALGEHQRRHAVAILQASDPADV